MNEIVENKMLFKCKHCENDDLRYFNFQSLEFQSDNVKNSPYKQNWTRETAPKIPVGLHIRCAKCNKDTFMIPDSYQPTMWGEDIPKQCIVNIKFEKPQYSAVVYALMGDGFLDQIVLTVNNERFSVLTKTVLPNEVTYSIIDKKQYDILIARGLKEVGYTEPVAEIKLPDMTEEKPNQPHQNGNNRQNSNKSKE